MDCMLARKIHDEDKDMSFTSQVFLDVSHTLEDIIFHFLLAFFDGVLDLAGSLNEALEQNIDDKSVPPRHFFVFAFVSTTSTAEGQILVPGVLFPFGRLSIGLFAPLIQCGLSQFVQDVPDALLQRLDDIFESRMELVHWCGDAREYVLQPIQSGPLTVQFHSNHD